MPDILEINQAVQAEWMGAKVELHVYEWISALESVACPQIVVNIPQADGEYRGWLQIHPEFWPTVDTDFIVTYFKNEIARAK